MEVTLKIGICLLIYELRLVLSFNLNKEAVLDSEEYYYNNSNNLYIDENKCKTTSEFLDYLHDSKTEFPKFETYVGDLTTNCKTIYSNNTIYNNNNKKIDQGLCYKHKLNNQIHCCMGRFEDSMLSYIREFECLVATIGSGNATLKIFGDQEENALNKRIMDITNATKDTLGDDLHNETQSVLNDSKIIESYKESLELLNLVKIYVNEIVEMFLFEGDLFDTQISFIKYIVSIFCGLCSKNIKQMIMNTGSVNIVQMNPMLLHNTQKIIMKNYKKLFEKLSMISTLILKRKTKIENIIDLHSEWITNILYNQLKESSYDMNGLVNANNNLVNDLFKKRSINSRNKMVSGLQNYNKIGNFVGIISMNSIKKEINSIVKDNYKNTNWTNNILHCIREIPIYSEYIDSSDYLNIENNKYEMYITAGISDPSGHTFISNFIIIPLECLKTVISGILKIIPDPTIDLIAYEEISKNELINTKDIAKKVISLFRNETLGENNINNKTINEEMVKNRSVNNYEIKQTHLNGIKDYNKNNNNFVNKYEKTEIGNEEEYREKYPNDVSNRKSFVVVSNAEVPDISELSKSPPYSNNIEGYLYLMKSGCFDTNLNYILILGQVLILVLCLMYY